MAFITDDVCAEVVLCEPNDIVQNCLPEYESLTCRIAATETVPEKYYKHFLNFEDGPNYRGSVEYTIEKAVRSDDGDDLNVVNKVGTDGNDWLSGMGLLKWIARDNGPAQVESSLYYNDPIHFFLNGGAGDDILQGANNSDRLDGGADNDRVYGMGGDDMVKGGTGDDSVFGGDGNDLVAGNAGDDSLKGGDGDDQVNGGLGNDEMYGDGGNDNLEGGLGDDYMDGGEGTDHMQGQAGDDQMLGREDDDCMDGGVGNDYVNGGSGDDLMTGGIGDDTLVGGDGDDQAEGGEGDDWVFGNAGNDLVSGGDGNDYVNGGDGDDIVRGGLGDDIMVGGDGCDQFVFCEVDYECFDTVADFNVTDRDQIDIADMSIDTVKVVLTGYDDEVFLDLMSNGEEAGRILVQNREEADIASVFSNDTTFGTGQGAVVQIGNGVMVDLPSTSVLHVEDGLFS